MASQAYYDWVTNGSPWKFARPIQAVADRLRAHGFTVYLQGNQEHLTATPPEDHTPFSATGWPGTSPYPYCMAMDIMPPAAGQTSKITGRALPTLQKLAAQLRSDKIAGLSAAQFVKYLNWEPGDGNCWHDSWMPAYARRTSTDRGHIHVSARTDYYLSGAADGYDLVARVMGDDMPLTNTDVDTILGRDAVPNPYADRATNPAITVASALKAAASADVKLDRVLALLQALSGKDFTDEPAIVAGVLAGLDPAVIAAAIPKDLAQQLLDALASRLAQPPAGG